MTPIKSAGVVLLLAVSAGLLSACREQEAGQASPARAPQEVSVVTLSAVPVALTTDLPGRARAFRVAEVRPQVNGILQKRLFTQGIDVREGQQLYQVDPSLYKAALKSAQANLVSTRARFERYETLVKQQAVSRQDYADARAAMLQAEAAVEQAQTNMRYTKVLAPITGRIGRSLVTEGALVSASQSTALAVITQLDPIYVDVTQPSRELLRLRRALVEGRLERAGEHTARVRLSLEDGSIYAHEGQLEFSEVSVDEGTGSVTLRAVFPNPERELLPGLFVHARLVEGVQQKAILVPQKGVSRDSKGEAVAMVVNAENRVEQRRLVTGRAVGNRWLVEEGLAEGDRVITSGLQFIQAGAEVHPVPDTSVETAPAAASAPQAH